MHLLGWGVDLDTRTKASPAPRRAPQSMVQELLNRSPTTTCGPCCRNGRAAAAAARLHRARRAGLRRVRPGGHVRRRAVRRLRRCSTCSATSPALEASTPTEPASADCWLERWRTTPSRPAPARWTCCAAGSPRPCRRSAPGSCSTRPTASCAPRSTAGEHRPRRPATEPCCGWSTGCCSGFVAEDRDALLAPGHADAETRATGTQATSPPPGCVGSPSAAAAAPTTTCGPRAHRWSSTALGRDDGLPALGLPGLGGLFDADRRSTSSTGAQLANRAAARRDPVTCRSSSPRPAARSASSTSATSAPRSSAASTSRCSSSSPACDPATQTFTLETSRGQRAQDHRLLLHAHRAGRPRLLDTALDPAARRGRARQPDPEAALLERHRLRPGLRHRPLPGRRGPPDRQTPRRRPHRRPRASPRAGAARPCTTSSPAASTASTSTRWPPSSPRCRLWLEALQPGRPLSFLDAHIKVGNALLGTTPALLAAGLPDAAFVALTGDDKT